MPTSTTHVVFWTMSEVKNSLLLKTVIGIGPQKFFFWWYLETKVFRSKPGNLEELTNSRKHWRSVLYLNELWLILYRSTEERMWVRDESI